MIVRTPAIPLSIFSYSSTSRIVHWLTRHNGKVSTLLKGACRPKSPFLGEYDLFSTSELLYFEKRVNTLHTGKECAMLHRRDTFRSDWRAMQAASYISAVFDRTTPDEAPQPELFMLYEELLDLAEEYGRYPHFLVWADLRFCNQQGHAPRLSSCAMCSTKQDLRFCASQGGMVCMECSRSHRLPILECPDDVRIILQTWQRTDHPAGVINTRLTGPQMTLLNTIMGTFMMYQFNLPTELRVAALAS